MMTIDGNPRRVTAEDRHARIAAESMLNASINSQRTSSYAQSVITPDTANEVLLAGSRFIFRRGRWIYNGRMSNVRRFFCLFITFDFCLTVLMWLICMMISGQNVQEAFIQQVVHYHIKSSLFDVVMIAFFRFSLLILFYALCYIDHWCIVALTTSSTCILLLSKVFLYNWIDAKQPIFVVLLILMSFILVWSEVWFLDIKVIPQEAQARDYYDAYFDNERAPLLSPNSATQAVSTENPSHFYTPMDSPNYSDVEDDTDNLGRKGTNAPFFPATISLKVSRDKIEECRSRAPLLLKRCYDLISSDDWNVEKVTAEGDIISYMVLPKPEGKIYKITGTMDMEAEKLLNCLYENIEASTKWNSNISESRKIFHINENTDFVYQATKSFGNGAVGARDFVILRHRGQYESYFISSGVSVNLNAVPKRKDFVRGENGVGCFATRTLANDKSGKCQFVWLLNTNLKGWLPQKVVDMSLSSTLLDFMNALRVHVRALKD